MQELNEDSSRKEELIRKLQQSLQEMEIKNDTICADLLCKTTELSHRTDQLSSL